MGSCIRRDRAEKDGTPKKAEPQFDHPGKVFFLNGIEWFLTGILVIESSSKCISDFQIFPVIKAKLPIE